MRRERENRYTRRECGGFVLGGALAAKNALAGAGKPNSKFAGVQVGIQSYSFRDRPLDAAIAGMVAAGINSCELYQGHVEPKNVSREELRKWRLSVPLEEFRKIAEKFRHAGITLYAYNLSFRDDFTDEEIARGFEMARALGAQVMTASANVSTAPRIYPWALKNKMRVGMHNHDSFRANEFTRPEDFAEAMQGRTPYIAINLDIGHFTAANYDPVDFIAHHGGDILTLHIKDRKRNRGPAVPFGEGDAPIAQVLQLLQTKKMKIPANIEYEYKGADSVEEVKKCVAYCRKVLQRGA